ncbi:peptidylprolyl isomerase [Nitratireductor mangrovi]|uniref:Parvulin-like PPIase n=1 Tax=Nitratireductor mangrovi TaxID=2599600 RepID=A0A5B8KW06_9HYPH|nr:peptidylprolyl isomerase [Nitratireductor mangrovi]QDY99833.1 peptidylprolyl isomerase [Nitratireductor mangrovi]
MPVPFAFRPLIACGIALGLAMTAPSLSLGAAADVVATVNGTPITEGDLAIAENDLDPQFSQLPAEQRRAAALSAIIEIRLLAGAAEEAGLGDNEDFQRRMAFLRDRALHSAFVDENVASQVNDETIRARYDQEIANTPPVNEIRARHILVKTREEADAVIKALEDGGDFEEIAKEKSTDGAAAQGGDLGYFGPGQMVPEFEKAAFALEVGAFSKEPVETQFGFHVIKVEDKRVQQPPAFDKVKDQVRSILLREHYFDAVKGLREKAEIDIPDEALKEAVGKLDRE